MIELKLHILFSLILSYLLADMNVGDPDHHQYQDKSEQNIASQSLSILSFNTWGLPVRLAGHDQKNRFEKIPSELVDLSADIVCLQECFAQDLRRELYSTLESTYFTYSDHTCYRRSMLLLLMDCYGGLMTFSKYPIIEETFHHFPKIPRTRLVEIVGAKGFLVSTIDLGPKLITVVNTHLYAGTGDKAKRIRKEQMQYMTHAIDSISAENGYDLFLVGDLNTDHTDKDEFVAVSQNPSMYQRLTTDLGFYDSVTTLEDADYTVDPGSNPYYKCKSGKQKIDYCLIRNGDQDQTAYHMTSEVVFKDDQVLSDHFGLLTNVHDVIDYRDEESVTEIKSIKAVTDASRKAN